MDGVGQFLFLVALIEPKTKPKKSRAPRAPNSANDARTMQNTLHFEGHPPNLEERNP